MADQVTDGTWEVVGFEAADTDGDNWSAGDILTMNDGSSLVARLGGLEFSWLGTVVP